MQPRTPVTSCIVLLLALGIFAAPPSRAGTIDGLVAYYTFDSSSSGTTPDLSGNNNPLTLQGNATIVSGGRFGDALSLGNHAGYRADYAVGPGDFVPLNLAGDFTIQAWVKFNDLSREQVLLEQFRNNGGPGWTLTAIVPSGTMLFYADDNTASRRPALRRCMSTMYRQAGLSARSLLPIPVTHSFSRFSLGGVTVATPTPTAA